MPSSKFSFPANGGSVAANQAFTITMNIKNMQTGNFVNAQENYFAAPQQLNGQGQIIGHTHFVVEAINSLGDTKPTDPKVFAFFKVCNTLWTRVTGPEALLGCKRSCGQRCCLSGCYARSVFPYPKLDKGVDGLEGLPAGAYRLCSINAGGYILTSKYMRRLTFFFSKQASATYCPCGAYRFCFSIY